MFTSQDIRRENYLISGFHPLICYIDKRYKLRYNSNISPGDNVTKTGTFDRKC